MLFLVVFAFGIPVQESDPLTIPRFFVSPDVPQEPVDTPAYDPASRQTANRQESDPFLEAIARIITHPFRDNGRRFDEYPYAGDGPYFMTRRMSDKMLAVMLETTFGRVDHDTISSGTRVMVNWSAGCDARIDVLGFEEVVHGRPVDSQLSHIHLSIGGYEGPATIDYSAGFGFGAIDDEESNDFGPSLRAGLRWFPVRPFSFSVDAVGTWFGGSDAIGDLRADMGIHLYRFALLLGVRGLIQTEGEDFVQPTVGFAVYF